MLPWTLLDTTTVPGDGSEMRLHQRGDEYSIRVENYELMNSREHGSEDALASLVCERLRGRKKMRVLIGGLGMGFTLLAVLQDAASDCEVVVSELVPAVVKWHRGPLASVSRGALDDPRVIVREIDVGQIIREAPGAYDAILLDVDNGPRALTAKGNDRLYSGKGLRAAYDALRTGGILAIWSSGPDPSFTKRLQQALFTVEEKRVSSRGGKGSRYLIWMATKET
jgi:spermidine synthase